MAYYVMANKATGHIQGINRPTLDRWPETDYYRFARDDLHNRQGPGELNERFHVGAGGDLIGPNTEVNLSAEGLVVSVVVEGAEPPPVSVDLDLGGAAPVSVTLTGGVGSIEIVADPPQVIEVRAADQETYYDAGGVTINLE